MKPTDRSPSGNLNQVVMAVVGQAGCLTLVVVLGSLALGLWLDRLTGLRPLFTLILMFAGVPVSIAAMLVLVRKTMARLKTGAAPKGAGETRE
jgi:F0F1-type ATP synthase assembly protein I